MLSSALTPENSAIVMIDHAVGFGNVFRSYGHELALRSFPFHSPAARLKAYPVTYWGVPGCRHPGSWWNAR
jgi:hypothetical protein